ncbi:MAG: hypothetical protein C0432_00065 [Candidatus Puniceispirillum sp.]|nr:hypothetical protein [Candidatus Pelagibacter sp.]MBA4282678.1 hypothetical protein [Candidatus Puniceispirillum sp.]
MTNFAMNALQSKILEEMKSLCSSYLNLQQNRVSRTWSKLFSQYQKKGIYIYGSVGRGKTMLCQTLFDELDLSIKKLSIHFDQFMHDCMKDNTLAEGIINERYKELDVLWIDELQIYDIASAMLLKKIIPELLANGIFVIMSGNIDPINFYKGGLNREIFSGFIPYFYENFDCLHLKGEEDYRFKMFNQTSSLSSRKFFLIHASSDQNLLWNSVVIHQKTKPTKLSFDDREWELKHTFNNDHSIYLTIDELLNDNRGAIDYINLVQNFTHIYIENLTSFTDNNKDLSRRFMTFIDNVYEYKTKLYISSLVSIENIFQVHTTDISYERTLSRLVELLS